MHSVAALRRGLVAAGHTAAGRVLAGPGILGCIGLVPADHDGAG